MLFDLRGRGRRRTVQVIYLGLALIFLLGFVGLGVGVGGSGGGLLNALTENSGSSGASYAGRVATAQKRVKREPSNPKAWAQLTEVQLLQAGESTNYSQVKEGYTAKGKELLAQVSHSWSTYLNLEPHNPSVSLARHMLRVYGEEGLNQPAQSVAALQLVIPSEPPSATLYADLAEYSYKAHDVSQGDLASEKAVSLAPAAQRKQIKTQLEAIKADPNASASAASSAVPSGTYTTTVDGKKTVLKSSGGGTLTSVPATTPSHSSSAKK
jgi:hypothetical protein